MQIILRIILIYNLSNISSPFYLSEILSTNAVKDLTVTGKYLYSALGSDGVAIYDLSNPADPQFLDSFNTNTMANRIAIFDGKVAVADWDDVDVLEVENQIHAECYPKEQVLGEHYQKGQETQEVC